LLFNQTLGFPEYCYVSFYGEENLVTAREVGLCHLLVWENYSFPCLYNGDNIYLTGLFIYLFLMMVGIKPRASCMLDKHSTTELHPWPYFTGLFWGLNEIVCESTCHLLARCPQARQVIFLHLSFPVEKLP
jgi:hypothetical protein